jgi:hypothetical protein
MALVKNTNSYATVEEANTYFSDRLDVAAWTDAPDSQKSQSLISATMQLDDLRWVGVAVSENQPLAFPRTGEYFDPKKGIIVALTTSVPNEIIRATFELAYHFLNNDGLLDDVGSVKNISVGNIQLTDIKRPSKIPLYIREKIQPLLQRGGTNIWWRAN